MANPDFDTAEPGNWVMIRTRYGRNKIGLEPGELESITPMKFRTVAEVGYKRIHDRLDAVAIFPTREAAGAAWVACETAHQRWVSASEPLKVQLAALYAAYQAECLTHMGVTPPAPTTTPPDGDF